MYIPRLADQIIRKDLSRSKVIIILGARQVGKTTLIERIVREKKGLILNLDLEVDKARLQAAGNLSPVDSLKSLGDPRVLVIDEAQALPEVGRLVKGLFDAHVPTKIILLGSSSLNLLDQTAESLTGRNEKVYLPPLLFREILATQPWYSPSLSYKVIANSFAKQIESLLMLSLVYGSYPETILTSDKERYLLNLTSDYLLKDILQLGLVKSPDLIRRLLLLLAYQTGAQVSVNELANSLSTSRSTLERYLELLERTFVIFRLPAFSSNQRKEIAKSEKIFFWDTGIRNALLKEFSLSPYRSDRGLLWENWVIAEFAKKNCLRGFPVNLYFWRTTDGAEVDLVSKGTNTFKAYEIKWTSKQKVKARSFEKRYGIPVETISRENIGPLLK